jgi:hypothetical protein
MNWNWCDEYMFKCHATVTVDSDVCSSGIAVKRRTEGRNQYDKPIVLDGCSYAYVAVYACYEDVTLTATPAEAVAAAPADAAIPVALAPAAAPTDTVALAAAHKKSKWLSMAKKKAHKAVSHKLNDAPEGTLATLPSFATSSFSSAAATSASLDDAAMAAANLARMQRDDDAARREKRSVSEARPESKVLAHMAEAVLEHDIDGVAINVEDIQLARFTLAVDAAVVDEDDVQMARWILAEADSQPTFVDRPAPASRQTASPIVPKQSHNFADWQEDASLRHSRPQEGFVPIHGASPIPIRDRLTVNDPRLRE